MARYSITYVKTLTRSAPRLTQKTFHIRCAETDHHPYTWKQLKEEETKEDIFIVNVLDITDV